MERGKFETKKNENADSRQATFSKRHAGLFKKANELAVLCEAEVAVIMYSTTGNLSEFANPSMKEILSKFKKCVETAKGIDGEPEPEKPQQPKEEDTLKGERENFKLKLRRLLGKDLTDMSSQEVHLLERNLNEGLIRVKDRKEQLMLQELAQYNMKEQRAVLEKKTLCRQVEELRGLIPPTRSQATRCIDYLSSVKKSNPAVKEGTGSPNTACNGWPVEEDSDINLQLELGLPCGSSQKRKRSDGKTH